MTKENNNNEETKNINKNVKKNKYNPEDERCCSGCTKTLKTKEGILKSEYDFNCGECHQWYRKRDYVLGGIIIGFFASMIILWVVIGSIEEKSKRKDDD